MGVDEKYSAVFQRIAPDIISKQYKRTSFNVYLVDAESFNFLDLSLGHPATSTAIAERGLDDAGYMDLGT